MEKNKEDFAGKDDMKLKNPALRKLWDDFVDFQNESHKDASKLVNGEGIFVVFLDPEGMLAASCGSFSALQIMSLAIELRKQSSKVLSASTDKLKDGEFRKGNLKEED